MSANASLEELETRLVAFTEQLQNIHELLQSDPVNTEFLSIAKDLVEVIQLTKETIDLKVNATSSNHVSAPQETLKRCQEPQALGDLEIKFAPGSSVEALQQGVWYPAHVDSVTDDGSYNVTFLGFGTIAELQQDAVTALGFQVLFDGYGNSEEVPYEYLSAALKSSDAEVGTAIGQVNSADAVDGDGTHVAVAATEQKVAPAVIHKPIKIPENLQILPSDTEAEKERKRKRLRAIKSLNRHKNIDNERNIKQHDWKAFQYKAKKKGIKKGVSGVLSKRGSSMFASPETVHGRVGVVGSDQGMTNFSDTRNKKPRHA
ncbi:unnamed protein product [Peronospora belbahrii]|uniref:Tudor domain-containing protein n=1 Tax=Peronospora belbahrii TaxID=622444 RepID=A0ABN8D7I2_9STRA|nr:unnamed protein product [Peronospora belbahrii]